MADAGYLRFVWKHVLRGAELRTIEPGSRGAVLVFASPRLRDALETETVRVELRTKVPLRCALASDADAPPVALADLLAAHELFVPGGASGDDSLTLSGSLDDEGRALSPVTLLLDGELGAITTAEGRRLSQMKVFSIGKASALAASGLVDIDVLKARKEQALAALAPVLRTAGFTGSDHFWVRLGPVVTHAIELVNSRWNTYLGLAFHHRLHAIADDLRARRPACSLALFRTPGPVAVSRTSLELLPDAGEVHVEQDTTVADLAARLTRDFTLCFLPWLDSMTDEASIVVARDVMVR